MNVELITIGQELLRGHTLNTNASKLSKSLTELGFCVVRHTVISDEASQIKEAFQEAMHRSPIVISTGGLGPTIDDLTREASMRVCKSTPIEFDNSIGTAKGLLYEESQSALILLPGVPREMEVMYEQSVIAYLKNKKIVKQFTCSRSLCLLKKGELDVDSFLRELKKNHPDVGFGIYPSQATLLVEFCGPNRSELEELCALLEQKFSGFIFQEATIAEALHAVFISSRQTLALAESCTGGAIAASLTLIPDASKFLLGSFVVYSNAWKESFLGVSSKTLQEKGEVSRETVEEMVTGLLDRTKADFAAAVSGVAGPLGGSEEKPVGSVYIAVGKRGEKVHTVLLHAPADRQNAIDCSVKTTMAILWRRLVHNQPTIEL